MPRYSFEDDDDDLYGDPRDQRNPLRDVVKDLEKKLEKEAKARQEAEERASKVEKSLRSKTVAEVLKEKGANPALARYALQDLEDPSPESVNTWLIENGELFGYKPQPATNAAQLMGLPADTALPPDLVAAYEKFMTSQQGGLPSSQTPEQVLAAKLADPALTRAELEALIASA